MITRVPINRRGRKESQRMRCDFRNRGQKEREGKICRCCAAGLEGRQKGQEPRYADGL